ncbi:hypothetical protein [Parablautia muri]|uniref:Uncharacterized protein n=1 Tax=Parablautia muri TaxID=2320879 RepID=A0A9X5BG16_9FIRM|nr:hypothetical protein [Parablautia muri]NBJ93013.1 hypothetical protein [Parablautia muri]
MHTKTMEGLVGARTNMNQLNTPMRIYKEARRRGDTATMERAMGYVNDFSDKAQEYKAKADEGMEEDAKETREKAKLQCEEAIRKRKEEREKLEEKARENRNADTNMDNVEISEEGKAFIKDNPDMDTTEAETDGLKSNGIKEPVTYTKEGEAVLMEQEARISVSV